MGREAQLLSVPRDASEKPTVISCAITPRQQARLTDALRGRAVIRSVTTFRQTIEMLRSTVGAVDLVVLPFRDQTGVEATSAVRAIVADFPKVAIVAYCDADSRYSADIRSLAAAGVHEFIFSGIDDAGIVFRSVLDSARSQCAAEWVMRQLVTVVPAALHPLAEAALSNPDRVTTVGAMATNLGVARKTVFNRCARSWSLSPEEFLTWVRLALVAHYLESTGCTIEAIALQLSFPSVTALRNTMKRYTGLTASEVRSVGGVFVVVQALARKAGTCDALPTE